MTGWPGRGQWFSSVDAAGQPWRMSQFCASGMTGWSSFSKPNVRCSVSRGMRRVVHAPSSPAFGAVPPANSQTRWRTSALARRTAASAREPAVARVSTSRETVGSDATAPNAGD